MKKTKSFPRRFNSCRRNGDAIIKPKAYSVKKKVFSIPHERESLCLKDEIGKYPQIPYFEKTSTNPDVFVKITHVPTGGKPRKDGMVKRRWGFLFSIYGEEVPLYLGSTDDLMLYAAILLYTKKRRALSKKLFMRTVDTKSLEVKWLKNLFELICPDKQWNNWYTIIANDPSKHENYNHRLYQATSCVNRKVSKALNSFPEEVKNSCKIDSKTVVYQVGIDPSHISLGDDLLETIQRRNEKYPEFGPT